MRDSLSKLTIHPGKLSGSVKVSGAKNAALRHLAATLLTKESVEIVNYPSDLLDIKVHQDMIERLGKTVNSVGAERVVISEPDGLSSDLKWEGRSIRNTLLILGALVTRTGFGSVPLPGGCSLGERKYDLHINVLENLGATVWEKEGRLCASAPSGLKGSDIYLPIRSTGATENAIISASLAQGVTRIWNPHIRPEIIDLITLLRKMGLPIRVFGQERIEVMGVDELSGAYHEVIPDSLEALTWAIGAAITQGMVEIENFPKEHLIVALEHLESSGLKIFYGPNSAVVQGGDCYPLEVSTGPHPGINSDVQPLLAVWAAHSQGLSKIIDLRFPGRYGYASELALLGMDYQILGETLSVKGKGGQLRGSMVKALDLRCGAAELLCGLTAEGETSISDAWQINRGYSGLDRKLSELGVDFFWSD